MSKELVSALQEFLRTFLLGLFIPLGATLLVVKNGINIEVGGFDINWLLALSIFVSGVISSLQVAVMSAADKYLHKKGVETPLDFKSLDSLK